MDIFLITFFYFEKWQRNHNNLDCHKCIWNIFHQLQSLHAQSVTQIKNVFTCSKHSNLKIKQSLFLSNVFFLPNVHHSFWKLKKILTLMIRRAKGLELIKIVFITHLSTFNSKVPLILKIMDFENMILTKVVHYFYIW